MSLIEIVPRMVRLASVALLTTALSLTLIGGVSGCTTSMSDTRPGSTNSSVAGLPQPPPISAAGTPQPKNIPVVDLPQPMIATRMSGDVVSTGTSLRDGQLAYKLV